MSTPFGTLLRQFRQARGLRQVDVARRAGCTQGAVTNWEHGYRPARSPEVPLSLARAFHLSAGERDRLLLAAGFAPAWLQAAVDDPELLYRLWAEVRDSTRGQVA